jgi:hypothetical protein
MIRREWKEKGKEMIGTGTVLYEVLYEEVKRDSFWWLLFSWWDKVWVDRKLILISLTIGR